MPTTGMPWIRSGDHRGENRGKRVMQISATQISPAGAFTGAAIHCKKDSSSLSHNHFLTATHPNSLTEMPEVFTIPAM